jgi:hypothetical protein
MTTHAILTALIAPPAAQAADDGLSLGEILSDLPTDPASIFTLLLAIGSVALVLWFGRPKGGKGGKPA